MCTPCNLTCRTCQNSYSCSSCQLSQFIDPSTSLCANCDLNCLACTNSSTQCTMCKPGWFLYNQVCYQIQPNGTYCDLNNNCQTCGALPLCKYCDKSLQNCIHCMSEQDYLLNGVCSSQQPPNTYCNQQNICQQCPDTCQGCDFMLNCIQCVNQQYFFYFGKCYQKQPINTYCTLYSGIQNYCQNCHPSCSQCFGKQVNQCLACQEGFRLVNTSCTCQNLGYGFNDASQQCEVCQISGCIQCSMSLSQCELCSKELQLDQQSGQCYCLNQFQYYSIEQKSCIFNKVQFCKISSKFQNTCEQCQDGYYNFKNQLCTYCGKFKYSNSQNQCINNCQKGCIICIDNQSCLLSQTDVQNNQNGNLPIDTDKKFCHYSCRLCNGSGNQNCLMCSSQTRIYDALTQTCTCKDGYFDTVYLKPFQSTIANLETTIIELVISSSFILYSFKSSDLINDFEGFFNNFITVSLLFLQIFGLAQCFIQISFIVYKAIKFQQVKNNINSIQVELIPQYIQKDISDVHEASQALQGIFQELTNCGQLEQIYLNVFLDYTDQQYEDLGKAIKQCQKVRSIYLFIKEPHHTPNLKKFIKQISYLDKLDILEISLLAQYSSLDNICSYFENLQEISKLINLKILKILLNTRKFINMKCDIQKIQQFGFQISNLKNLLSITIDFGPINTYNKYCGMELDKHIIQPLKSFYIKNKKIIQINISYDQFDPYENSTYE
ncbi:hypothetical protein ABPG73_018332 [Tetrahymena malaccensis]